MKKIRVFCKNPKGIISNLTLQQIMPKHVPIRSSLSIPKSIISSNLALQTKNVIFAYKKLSSMKTKLKAMLLKTIIY